MVQLAPCPLPLQSLQSTFPPSPLSPLVPPPFPTRPTHQPTNPPIWAGLLTYTVPQTRPGTTSNPQPLEAGAQPDPLTSDPKGQQQRHSPCDPATAVVIFVSRLGAAVQVLWTLRLHSRITHVKNVPLPRSSSQNQLMQNASLNRREWGKMLSNKHTNTGEKPGQNCIPTIYVAINYIPILENACLNHRELIRDSINLIESLEGLLTTTLIALK